MKTEFIKNGITYKPCEVVFYTGPDGRARLMREWALYYYGDNDDAFCSTIFKPVRATKKEISE